MKILIIGYGCVGKAVASVFKKNEVLIVDPKFNNNKIKDFKNSKIEAVFVCVDTPANENFTLLNNVLREINNIFPRGTVVCCKSTALPQFYFKAQNVYKNIQLVFNPEFLSHRTSIKDFNSQKFCILGGRKTACKKIANIYMQKIKSIERFNFTDLKTAAFIKYSENCFLAYKVTFFNELYKLHKNLKIPVPFNKAVKILTQDTRIGASHTLVPGHDGKKGWGGHCLTKDVGEFYKLTKSSLLKFLIKLNRLHRKC